MKKHKITIATATEEKGSQSPVIFDLDVLRTSHVLITGVSGSGKSYAIRVLVENVAAILPIFVIDPEGEYASLREKFNFVLVGEGGDIPIHPNTAATTARRLMNLNVSAIFDLSSLPVQAQHLWVRNFFDELMALPRKEWHPLLIVLDEAHIFCPEEGDSDAHDVMLDVAKRGRKRGWTNAWATQRLSGLDKDAAAELQNTVIGRTTLHNDRDRAAKILGVLKREHEEFYSRLKVLQPGQFYFQGVAVSADMILGKIIPATTRHPEPGSHKEITFPTPAQIKALLPDLNKITEDAVEAEKKERSLEEENRSLRTEIETLRSQPAGPDPVELQQKIDGIVASALTVKDAQWQSHVEEQHKKWAERVRAFVTVVNEWVIRVGAAATEVKIGTAQVIEAYKPLQTTLEQPPKVFFLNEQHELPRPVPGVHADAPPIPVKRREAAADGGRGPGRAERRILRILALCPSGCSREKLGIRTVYAHQGGAFKKAMSNLRSWGMVTLDDPIKITDAGRAVPHDLVPKPGLDLMNAWLETLGKAEKAILSAVWHGSANGQTKAEIGAKAGYDWTGGAFKKAMSNLRTLGLVNGKETLKPSPHLVLNP